jgi:hypothetical protein
MLLKRNRNDLRVHRSSYAVLACLFDLHIELHLSSALELYLNATFSCRVLSLWHLCHCQCPAGLGATTQAPYSAPPPGFLSTAEYYARSPLRVVKKQGPNRERSEPCSVLWKHDLQASSIPFRARPFAPYPTKHSLLFRFPDSRISDPLFAVVVTSPDVALREAAPPLPNTVPDSLI